MLQYIAQTDDRYSIAEQAQMAIEGGCKWVVLHLPEMADPEIREIAAEVIPLCKETSTILTMVGHVELAKELAIHGVVVRATETSAPDTRELLGPEAIIGVEVDRASQAIALRETDIDYIVIQPDMPVEQIAAIVHEIQSAGTDMRIVASGDYPTDTVIPIMATGVNGIALHRAIADASDPVAETARVIEILDAVASVS